MSECDFCLARAKTLIPINGGLWAICSACNDYTHIQMNIINQHKKLEKEPCVCDGGTRRDPLCCSIVPGEEE